MTEILEIEVSSRLVESHKVIGSLVNEHTGLPENFDNEFLVEAASYSVPNISHIWGRLGKNAKGELDGTVEPMKWGISGGVRTAIRFSTSCESLSLDYQRNVLKLPETYFEPYFEVKGGINRFSKSENPQIVEFLKLSSMNADSVCRNPETIAVYKIHDTEAKIAEAKEEARVRKEMGKIYDAAIETSENAEMYLQIIGLHSTNNYSDNIKVIKTSVTEDAFAALQIIEGKKSMFYAVLKQAEAENRIDIINKEGKILEVLTDKKAAKNVLYEGIGTADALLKFASNDIFNKTIIKLIDNLKTKINE
jgi:hypothetical protein